MLGPASDYRVAPSNTLGLSWLARLLLHLKTGVSFHSAPVISSTFHQSHMTAGLSATSLMSRFISKVLISMQSENGGALGGPL